MGPRPQFSYLNEVNLEEDTFSAFISKGRVFYHWWRREKVLSELRKERPLEKVEEWYTL